MSAMMMSKSDLAEILFASTLQESEHPSHDHVRNAIDQLLARDHGRGGWLAQVAQEAGDHPDVYVSRMRWALRVVEDAYAGTAEHLAAA